jgi:hypothetical protein
VTAATVNLSRSKVLVPGTSVGAGGPGRGITIDASAKLGSGALGICGGAMGEGFEDSLRMGAIALRLYSGSVLAAAVGDVSQRARLNRLLSGTSADEHLELLVEPPEMDCRESSGASALALYRLFPHS